MEQFYRSHCRPTELTVKNKTRTAKSITKDWNKVVKVNLNSLHTGRHLRLRITIKVVINTQKSRKVKKSHQQEIGKEVCD